MSGGPAPAVTAVTVAALSGRPAGPLEAAELCGLVRGLRGLRAREYEQGLVLDFTLDDGTAAVRVFLRDAWATALTFLAAGDVVRITRPTLEAPPQPAAAALLTAGPETVVVVEQGSEHGDVMLLRVTARTAEAQSDPEVSVKNQRGPRVLANQL